MVPGPSTSATGTGPSAQAASNSATWSQGKYVGVYANNILTPVEVQIFVRYQAKLSGRVLDVGCGAGRVLSYLVMIGADAHGIDIAPRMVDYCRRVVPAADVRVGDVKDIRRSVDGSFDAVIAPDNLIDVFDDAARRQVIGDIKDVLAPGGLFIFSTHDLGWAESNPGPREWEQPTRGRSLRKLLEKAPADYIQALRNRREIAANRERLAPLEERHDDYAIINDFPHNYSLLHYYIRSDAQERQLRDLGYELVECLAADGSTVTPGSSGNTDSLHYVARPL